MKVAQIESNVVVNTIEVDSIKDPKRFIDISDRRVGIGWHYDGVDFIDPDEAAGEPSDDELMERIRGTRNMLLAETDFYATLQDVNLSDEMIAYRQALRDLPLTVSLNTPIYPTKPTGG